MIHDHDMTVATWNIQGFGERNKVKAVQNWLKGAGKKGGYNIDHTSLDKHHEVGGQWGRYSRLGRSRYNLGQNGSRLSLRTERSER
ncbi:hypothetical protein R1sor_024179 [Riccia sorocarpa]|uniref:Endonuclease/exonuclease/phosphatase n=1 Tax=Riccia sorocarpa TaxID=122646 RepID=A0ABD3GPW5_9MARC